MAETNKRKIGNIGEKYSCKFLKKQKYKIITTNYNTKFGEIDIVAEKDNYIIFVEVKTRKEGGMYTPSLAVTRSKQEKIFKTAYLYLKEYPQNKNIRFDVMEVIHQNKKVVKINHIKNAFCQGGSYGRF